MSEPDLAIVLPITLSTRLISESERPAEQLLHHHVTDFQETENGNNRRLV